MENFLNWLIGVAQNVGLKLLAAILTWIIGSLIIKLIIKIFPNGKKFEKMDQTVKSFLNSFVSIGLWVILIVCIVAILGVPMASVIAAIASCGVAIGLAMQGSLSNLAGGIMLLLFRPFGVGEFIETSDVSGTVREIGIFYTMLVTGDNKHVTIPNGTMMNNTVINYSREALRRVDMDFGITYEANLIRFDKTIFKVSAEGTATILKEKNNFMLDLPDVDFYNGTYYITETDASFVVYDTNLEFVSNWKYKFANHDGIDYDYFILSDGTILFQSFETLPEDAKDYDYCEDGEKIKVETVLIDPKKGTEKSTNISFVIHESIALDELGGNETYSELEGISEKYKNLALISYIEDKKLTAETIVALNNNGKVTEELFTDLPMIENGEMPYIFSSGIFYYHTINDTIILINAENEKIMEVSTSAFNDMELNDSYIVLDGVIYDYNLRVVYDFGAENYELYTVGWYTDSVMSEGILLTRDGAVYLYKNGATNLIISKDSNDKLDHITNDIYVIKREGNSGDDRYVHFNARGQELFTSFGFAGSLILSDSELGIALFMALNPDGKITYYRLSK